MSSRNWELEAKEAVERVVRAQVERDAARHEASMARLDAKATGSAWVQVESELARGPTCLGCFRGCPSKGGV